MLTSVLTSVLTFVLTENERGRVGTEARSHQTEGRSDSEKTHPRTSDKILLMLQLQALTPL